MHDADLLSAMLAQSSNRGASRLHLQQAPTKSQ